MTPRDRELKEVGDRIRGLATDWVMRTERALPHGDTECRSLFEQWADSLRMFQKHVGDPRAKEYMLACLELLGAAMEARGVETY